MRREENINLNDLLIFSGVGKSTFINCLRGLEAEDEGAAGVGVVETTNQPTPYEHPDFSNLKIWDLPGRYSFFHELKFVDSS